MKCAQSADAYFDRAGLWREELRALRKILLAAWIEKCVKWGGPCYTIAGGKIVGLGGLKSYFGLRFFQGALLEDKAGAPVNAQARQDQGDAPVLVPPALARALRDNPKAAARFGKLGSGARENIRSIFRARNGKRRCSAVSKRFRP